MLLGEKTTRHVGHHILGNNLCRWDEIIAGKNCDIFAILCTTAH